MSSKTKVQRRIYEQTVNGIRIWETNNDANYNNRHAEYAGVEFFAFPHQSLVARVGNFSARIGEWAGLSKSASLGYELPNGKTVSVDHDSFDDVTKAIKWAALYIAGDPSVRRQVNCLSAGEEGSVLLSASATGDWASRENYIGEALRADLPEIAGVRSVPLVRSGKFVRLLNADGVLYQIRKIE